MALAVRCEACLDVFLTRDRISEHEQILACPWCKEDIGFRLLPAKNTDDFLDVLTRFWHDERREVPQDSDGDA